MQLSACQGRDLNLKFIDLLAHVLSFLLLLLDYRGQYADDVHQHYRLMIGSGENLRHILGNEADILLFPFSVL